jgi:hypothetical protein
MARTFSAPELITLPRLSAGAALSLGTELVTVANAQRSLPAPIGKSKKRLEAALEELRGARRAAHEADAIDTSAAATADQTLDAGWSSFYSFLQAWAKLPGEGAARASFARRLLDLVYPDGLKFTQLGYKLEWAESQTRLDRLAEKANVALVKELGGELFVRVLREAHREYGVALKITEAKEEAKAAAKVRAPLDAFADALRRYALRVTSYAEDEDDDEAAGALAAKLLAPLATWRTAERRAGRLDVGEGPSPAAPEDPSAGD